MSAPEAPQTARPPSENPSSQNTVFDHSPPLGNGNEKGNLNSSSENGASLNPESAFWQELHPADSWTPDGRYWAELPRGERTKFVNAWQYRDLADTAAIEWANFKRDPLLPLIDYWRNYVLPGMGLFTEGYVLFSIGNLKSLFQKAFPTCWGTFRVCNKTWTQTTDYLQIVGIILGQATVGVESDWVGRRFGLIQDASIMMIGVILLTAVWGGGGSLQGWVVGYAISQLIYGFGVGGEYPMTATLAMERASSVIASANDRLHRGRRTVGAFLMQGWGQVANQTVLIILLLITNSSGNGPYSEGVAQVTYRLSFVFVGIFVLWLLYYRIYRLKGANHAIDTAKAKVNVSGYDYESMHLALTFFWHRLFATAFGWFANDFFFYGNKIFTAEFLAILQPTGASTMSTWLWNLLNVFVALIGYYFAFFLIDDKHWGRVRMQTFGFLMVSAIFLCCAAAYPHLTRPGANIKWFQFLFFFSSFWEQFGPNCVTFLVAAEVYPANIRGSAHGMSAAIGKLGALAPTVMYNYIDNRTKFWVVWPIGLAGAIVTWVFLPDTTGLDLREQERRWAYMRSGRAHEYHGIAIHPRHLSMYERVVLKQHLNFDSKLDREMRINELREIWRSEAGNKDSAFMSEVSPVAAAYFEKEQYTRKDGHPLAIAPPQGAGADGTLGRVSSGMPLH